MKRDLEEMLSILECEKSLVVYTLVVVIDIHLRPCTKTCELAFPGCSIWLNSQSQICSCSSGTCGLVLEKVRIACLHLLPRKWGPPSSRSVFDVS